MQMLKEAEKTKSASCLPIVPPAAAATAAIFPQNSTVPELPVKLTTAN